MSAPGTLTNALTLLERLVAFDTRNPPRAIDAGGIFACLVDALGLGFDVRVRDMGEGCVGLLAVRGTPRVLFNVHVDTVPADAGWQGDPLRLVVAPDGARVTGLGACDTKGAAACLVTAARESRADVALLFTSDEEAGSSRCVKGFLEDEHGFESVVVAEPTRCAIVREHRGIATCNGVFHGVAGHASAPRALVDSAIHEAVHWSERALAFALSEETQPYQGLHGIRFNLGTIKGGTKANMIASSAELRYGVRPRPDQDPRELLEKINALAPDASRVTWTPGFLAPPLRARGESKVASALGVELGEPVDFWTEAALFAEAGLDTVVFGPGDIAQAHTAGEFVATRDLSFALRTYQRFLGAL